MFNTNIQTARESSARIMASLQRGAFQEHILSNAAIPFSAKQDDYLLGYSRMLQSRNCRYIMMCEGLEQ